MDKFKFPLSLSEKAAIESYKKSLAKDSNNAKQIEDHFWRFLYMGYIEFALEVCERLVKIAPSSNNYVFLAYTYWRSFLYKYACDGIKDLSILDKVQAVVNKILAKDPSNIFVQSFLSNIYFERREISKALDSSKKIIGFFKKEYSKQKNSLYKEDYLILRAGVAWLKGMKATSKLSKIGMIDDENKIDIKDAISLSPHNFEWYEHLSLLLILKKDYKEAIQTIRKYFLAEPRSNRTCAYVYFSLGMIYLCIDDFRKSLYFFNRCRIMLTVKSELRNGSEIACNLTMTINSWQKGNLDQGYFFLEKMAKCFSSTSEKFIQSFIRNLRLDEKFNIFSKVKDFASFVVSLKQFLQDFRDMPTLFPNFTFFDGLIEQMTEKNYLLPHLLEYIKIAFVISVSNLLDPEFLKQYLRELIHERHITGGTIDIIPPGLFRIESCEEFFRKIEYSRGLNFIENLEQFAREIDQSTLTKKIAHRRQHELVTKYFGAFHKIIGANLTFHVLKKIFLNNHYLSKGIESIREIMEEAQRHDTELQRIYWRINEISEVLQIEKQGIGKTRATEIKKQKKIEILTNVDEKGTLTDKVKLRSVPQSALKERKRKREKKKYLLWMYYESGEVYVFGKHFTREIEYRGPEKPRKNAKIREGYRKLIVYLLRNNGKDCSHKDIYEQYAQEKYQKTEKIRSRINSAIRCLKKYSSGILEDYITSDKIRKIKLDVKGHPVCVVFDDSN